MDDEGLVSGGGFRLPLTQEQLADILGLTSVHVNRTISKLAVEGLIVHKGSWFQIPDLAALKRVGDFREAYLFL